MDFYAVWKEMIEAGIDDSAAIKMFLSSDKQSIDPLLNGSSETLKNVFEVISSTPIERYIDISREVVTGEILTPALVPCFSNFENGAVRLNELLDFEPQGLSFSDAGYQLMNSVKDGARIKYGENHSKLAAIMSLVTISSDRPCIVRPTAWGTYLTNYVLHDKRNVLKALLLRDLCVRTIIQNAFNEYISYKDVVSCLSEATALRRRANVKYLVEFILSDTDYEYMLSRIDWKM